jgi:hypothetical protein
LNNADRNLLLAIATFFTPVVAVIVLHSTLYDAWRQLFFIYPAFVIICIFGLVNLSKIANKKLLYIVCFTLISLQGFTMYQMHPFENVYFNQFISREPNFIRHNYEQDYWGLSMKQSIEYILQQDKSKLIKISGDIAPCEKNARIMFSNNRIIYTDKGSADYFIASYRMHSNDFEEYKGKEFHSIMVNNSAISTIFKLK